MQKEKQQQVYKFSTIKEVVKANYNVVSEGGTWLRVRDNEGYEAYMQLNCYGYNHDKPDYYRSYTFSTRYKPNRKTGSGKQVFERSPAISMQMIMKLLDETLNASKRIIESGRERMIV